MSTADPEHSDAASFCSVAHSNAADSNIPDVDSNAAHSSHAVDRDALVHAHHRDMASLTKPSTRAAYGPFAIKYKECLELVFNSDLPNSENAYRFLLFHAYRPL